jgi:hypothetical protein
MLLDVGKKIWTCLHLGLRSLLEPKKVPAFANQVKTQSTGLETTNKNIFRWFASQIGNLGQCRDCTLCIIVIIMIIISVIIFIELCTLLGVTNKSAI